MQGESVIPDLGSDAFAADAFAAEVTRMRATLAASRSAVQLRLFDYLVARSGDARAPKEIEIALAVFSGEGTPETATDSGVRVYVHRLRKRLEDHYRDLDGPRLTIPKGEYRIVLALPERCSAPADQGTTPGQPASPHAARAFAWPSLKQNGRPMILASAAVMMLGAILALAWALWPQATDLPQDARPYATTFWRALGATGPVTVVAGDAYMLAQTNDHKTVERVILDPAITSREDLGQFVRSHPDQFYSLYDFDLHFTPVATAQAAWTVLQAMPHAPGQPTREASVLPASSLKLAGLQTGGVIYVGHLNAMGPLAAPVSAASQWRLEAGDSIVDPASKREFRATPVVAQEHSLRIDYGYIASLPGPGGHALLVAAGIGDLATEQMAALLASPEALGEIATRTANQPHFEAIYEVRARDGMVFSRRLVTAHALR